MMQKTPPYISYLIVAAVTATLVYWFTSAPSEHERTDAIGQLSRSVREATDPEAAEREAREQKNAESAEDQRRALSHRRKVEAVDLAKRATELYDAALGEEARWKTEVEALLTNEDGRFIVSDAALEKFQTAYKNERAARETLLAGKAGVETLIAPVRRTLDDPGVGGPLPELEKGIRTEKENAAIAAEKYQNDRLAIEALVIAGKETGERGNTTLADAVADLNRRKQDAANNAATTTQQQLLAQQQAAQEARARFLAAARDPALLAKFQPFLAPGYYTGGQIISLSGILRGTTASWNERYPASYSKLKENDVFSDFNMFRNVACGRERYHLNDRPTWVCTEANRQEHKNRWEDFKYYAPTWVELGLLSK